jgi:hypothetical protein
MLVSVSAADNSTINTSVSTSTTTSSSDSSATSYTCLINKIGNKTDLTLQEAVFSMLAVGEKGNIATIIDNNKNTNDACWPKSGCTIKDTALVALAYNRVGKDTDDIATWLNSKSATPGELSWYLEIDAKNHNGSKCTIKYDSITAKATIGSDMIVSISDNCFKPSDRGYWFRISDSCLDKKFTISCSDQDFITSLMYQRTNSNTYYVLSNSHSASVGGTTEEQVQAKCLKSGTACDYEGTLWGAIALQKIGKGVTSYIPYLLALSETNSRYFPSSLLYLLVGGGEQYSQIINNQKQGKYWEIVSNNKLYDTSLGLLALSGSSANEFENARNYLLSIVGKDGCWATLKDTAFLLYAGWPREVSRTVSADTPSCLSSGKYCAGSYECLQAGGLVQYGYSCSGVSSCCSINPLMQSCAAIGGKVCANNQVCSGDSAPSIDGTCCKGTCTTPSAQEFTCEQTSGRICKSVCGNGEQQISDSCESGVCCMVVSSGGSLAWLWITLLIILIIIIILAILYRDKLRLIWYQYNGKAKTSPAKQNPSTAQMPMMQRMMPPMMRPVQGQRPVPQRQVQRAMPNMKKPASSAKDPEMEETLRKLREMSK